MKLHLLKKSMFRTIMILMGVIIVIATVFHFWFVNNAETIIEDLVASRSNGRLKLEVRNMKFNYFSKRIELQDVVFYSTDTAGQKTAYRFSVENIKLQATAILPIVFKKQLRIDSLYLDAPTVEVTRLRPNEKKADRDLKDISVPEEMGRIYNSIQEAIDILEVNRFQLDKGKFILVNKMDPGSTPFKITNLHFQIDNLQLDSTKKEKVLFSDQIVLYTTNQDIAFPDGSHRLAFSKFRINVKDQLIEFDSCTISGKKPGNGKSGFSVFFDTLRLVNLDFKALYEAELVKADSVYCLNPKFNITLGEKERTEKGGGDIPNIDSLIQQFTGDMELGYVGVINSDIDITTYKNDVPTSFSSKGNSFEMRNLVIDHHLTKPVSVGSFAMAIRDYENFLKDSSYTLRFDSIHVRENKILLSNFSVNSEPGRPSRNVHVSQFELDGLSWSHLLFNKTLKAREATLYNPRIVYTQVVRKKDRRNRNIFQSLGGLNDIMELDRLKIVNGNIRMNLSNHTTLQLENAHLLVKSQVLLESKAIKNLEQSVEQLQFAKAILRIKGLLVELQDAKFTGVSDQLSIRYARAYTGRQTINATARDILLNEIIYNEETGYVNAFGVSWQQANIEVNQNPKRVKKKTSETGVHLESIDVNNTTFQYNGDNSEITAFFDNISAHQITNADKMSINGLVAAGRNLKYSGEGVSTTVGSFHFEEGSTSMLRNVSFAQSKDSSNITFRAPAINFSGDFNSFLTKVPSLNVLEITDPILTMKMSGKKDTTSVKKFPSASIGRLLLHNPSISVTGDSNSQFQWNTTKDVIINDLKTSEEGITLGAFKGDLSGAKYVDRRGKNTGLENAKLDVELANIRIRPGDTLQWSGILRKGNITGLRFDSVGKNRTTFVIGKANVASLAFNSGWLKDMAIMLRNNPDVSLQVSDVLMENDKTKMQWHNIVFNNKTNKLTVDSMQYRPALSRDSFIAVSEWQNDYMTVQTGKISLNRIDLDSYIRDSSVRLGVLEIEDPSFTTFRDKRKPFRAGIFKPLPTGLIRKIPFPLSLDTIRIHNGTVIYTELNEKTNTEGSIPITRMTGDIFPIRNFNIDDAHDTLRIRINAYIMDSAWLRLRVRESYLDTLNGFQLTVRLKPTSLTFLNQALAPLASVKIESAYLDTLNMRAIGHNELSLGEMRMYYRNLKVRLLKNGKEEKGFFAGIKTFIANTFIIRKNNKDRVGTVYFPRLQDRSFLNYYVKTLMSGVATSIGAKNNKRMLKKYKRELNKRQLPPIDLD